jgi:hypothetical protein
MLSFFRRTKTERAAPAHRRGFRPGLDGTIDYDASLDTILSGRGTSTLVIQGLPQ